MDNSVIYATIMYLLIFRLAIIILGGISIVLGYRLFVKGIFQSSDSGSSGSSELDAQFGDISLSVKNAAPGTFFAAFGVIIVTATMMSSHPEANFQTEKNPETGAMRAAIELRGEQNDSRCEQCDTLAAKLTKIAEAMNELAWIYSEDENSLESALVFSETAVELAPENANLLDTQAMLSFQLKEYKQAVAVMEKAVSLLENKPNHSQEELIKYQQKLAEYRKKLPLLGN